MSDVINYPLTNTNVDKYSSDKFILKRYYRRERLIARVETTGCFEHKDTVETIDTVRSTLEECYSFSGGFDKVLKISGDHTCTMIQEHINNYRHMTENTYKVNLEEGKAWELWIEELVLCFMKYRSHINRHSRLVYDIDTPKETKDVVLRTGKQKTVKK